MIIKVAFKERKCITGDQVWQMDFFTVYSFIPFEFELCECITSTKNTNLKI